MRAFAALSLVVAAAADNMTCGSTCNDGVHICDPQGECNLCMPVPPDSNTTFQCKAGCGAMCSAGENCGSGGCGKCDGGKCAAQPAPTPPPGPPTPKPPPMPTPPPPPPVGCGATCNDGVHECGGECGLCMPVNGSNTTFACGAGCGEACTQDEHCGSAGCGLCASQKCVPAPPAPGPVVACGGECQTNLNCDPQGECSVCVPKTSTTFMCSSPCLAACTEDAHCGVAGCMHCTNGSCASA